MIAHELLHQLDEVVFFEPARFIEISLAVVLDKFAHLVMQQLVKLLPVPLREELRKLQVCVALHFCCFHPLARAAPHVAQCGKLLFLFQSDKSTNNNLFMWQENG